MACGTGEDKAKAENVGLVSGHAYTLIGCTDYKGTQLVRLRNPVSFLILLICMQWGAKEWKGK